MLQASAYLDRWVGSWLWRTTAEKTAPHWSSDIQGAALRIEAAVVGHMLIALHLQSEANIT